MMGLYVAVPLNESKNLSLFFKPMMGASFVAQGSTTYNLIAKEPGYNNGTVNVTTAGQSYAFAYSFALGLKYDITPLFAFMAQVDYMFTKPMFNITPYYVRMQVLSFNLGLALKVN